MSDNLEKGDSVTPETNSVSEGSQNSGSAGNNEISVEAFKRLQADLYKERNAKREALGKIESYEKQELEKNNRLKELLELERKEKEELLNYKNSVLEKEKTSSIRNEVVNKLFKLGLDPSKQQIAEKLMNNFEGVIYDDETKSVLGADRFAESFYKEHRDLNIFKQAVQSVDQRASSLPDKTEFSKLSKEEQLKMIAKIGL